MIPLPTFRTHKCRQSPCSLLGTRDSLVAPSSVAQHAKEIQGSSGVMLHTAPLSGSVPLQCA